MVDGDRKNDKGQLTDELLRIYVGVMGCNFDARNSCFKLDSDKESNWQQSFTMIYDVILITDVIWQHNIRQRSDYVIR